MILTAIVAMAANRVIGVDNDLPWHLPEDLKFFREKTKGAVLIMGRKTFESIKQPLPGRFHIVITRNPDFQYAHDRVQVVRSLEQAILVARTLVPPWPDEVFIVGGGEIYSQALEKTDRILLTRISRDYQGQAHFPVFEEAGHFQRVDVKMVAARDEAPAFQFEDWRRSER